MVLLFFFFFFFVALLMGLMYYVELSDHLVGEEVAGCFALVWFVDSVLSVLVCLLFLLVS